MKQPNECGELQYAHFTVWDRIKRMFRNLDAAMWYRKYGK